MVDTGTDPVRHPSIVDKHSSGSAGQQDHLIVVPSSPPRPPDPKTSSVPSPAAGAPAISWRCWPREFSAGEVKRMTRKWRGHRLGRSNQHRPADDKFIMVEYPSGSMPGTDARLCHGEEVCGGADVVVIDIPVGRNTKVIDVQEGRKLAGSS